MLPIPTEVLEAAAIAGAALVVFSIVRLLRVLRESILARLPAVPEQDVRFPAAGPVVLCIAGRRSPGWSALGVRRARRCEPRRTWSC